MYRPSGGRCGEFLPTGSAPLTASLENVKSAVVLPVGPDGGALNVVFGGVVSIVQL